MNTFKQFQFKHMPSLASIIHYPLLCLPMPLNPWNVSHAVVVLSIAWDGILLELLHNKGGGSLKLMIVTKPYIRERGVQNCEF